MDVTLPPPLAKPILPPGRGEAVRRYLRTLWRIAPELYFDADRPHLIGQALHLPVAGSDASWPDHCAAAAHAAAHLVFSPPVFDGRGVRPLVRALVGVLEDARIEALAARELPGLRRLWAPHHRVTPADGNDAPTLLLRLARALADPDYADPSAWIAKGRRLVYLDTAGTLLALHDPQALRQTASLLGHDLGQMRLPFNGRDYHPGPAYRDDHRWMWPQLQGEADEPVRAEPPPPTAAAPGEAGAPQADGPPEPTTPPAAIAPPQQHPEWDRHLRRLRPHWCTVQRVRAVAGPPLALTLDGHPLRAAVRKSLGAAVRRAQATAGQRVVRAAEGEVMDLSALVQARLSQRLHQTPDPRVYRRVRPAPAGGEALVLIDRSVSTADAWFAEGSGQGGTTTLLRGAIEAAALLADALIAVGVRTTVWAFHSQGRHRVQIDEVLAPGEPLDGAALGRLAALRPQGSTRLGAALREATRALCLRSAPSRRLWLISDGPPYAMAHDIDVHDRQHLAIDARLAVRQAALRGVTLRCLVLGEPAAACSPQGGPAAGTVVRLRGLADLPQQLRSLLAP
jgi:nitric oxide reductase NorD protein